MRLKAQLGADAALVLTTVIWGSTFVIAKDLLSEWPPLAYMALRFALAALVLLALFARDLFGRRGVPAGAWRAGAALGALLGGGFALQSVGLTLTTPARSSFITGLTTPLVPLVAFLLFRARPGLENLLGVALASLGGVLILLPQGAGERMNAGDLLTLFSTGLFAAHMVLLSFYAERHWVGHLTLSQITMAALFFILAWGLCLVLAAAHGTGARLPFVLREAGPLIWTGRVIWQLLYLALVATVLTFFLWAWGQAQGSATHAAVIFSLEPVFATLFAVLWRGPGEWLGGGRALLGALLILAGILVSELRLGPRRRRPAGEREA